MMKTKQLNARLDIMNMIKPCTACEDQQPHSYNYSYLYICSIQEEHTAYLATTCTEVAGHGLR